MCLLKTFNALSQQLYLHIKIYRVSVLYTKTRSQKMTQKNVFRYKSMGLTTVQSRENRVRMKVMREMQRSGVEAMRSKIGMKSNVIRNLPKNCTY